MADIYQIAASHRRRLDVGNTAAAKAMVADYGQIYQAARTELLQAMRDLADNDNAVWRIQRIQRITDHIREDLERFVQDAGPAITDDMRQAIDWAFRDMRDLAVAVSGQGISPAAMRDSADRFARLPSEAIQAAAGMTSEGSPLRALLEQIAPATAEQARTVLIDGLALGWGAEQVADGLRQALGTGLVRSMTIARTETMRAYNEGSRYWMLQHDEHLNGWYWHAACDGRTCAACWAMHGTLHPISEPLGSHPNCRCSMVPAVKSWEEMGYPGYPDRTWKPADTGETLFRDLPDDRIRKILGPRGYERYQAGQITKSDIRRRILGREKARLYEQGRIILDDLVRTGHHPQWGITRTERSLRDVRRIVAVRPAPPPIAPAPGARTAPAAAPAAAPKPAKPSRKDALGNPIITAESAARKMRKVIREWEASPRGQEHARLLVEHNRLSGRINELERRLSRPAGPDGRIWRAERDMLERSKDRIGARIESLERKRDDMLREKVIRLKHPIRLNVTKAPAPAGWAEQWDEGLDHFRHMVSRADLDGLDADIRYERSNPRSFYSYGDRAVHMGTHRQSTVVHEFGHWMEHRDAAVHDACIRFLDRRRGNESIRPLSDHHANYGPNERAWFDRFLDPYAGKDYGGAATEILSMGIQWMHESPYRLFTRDRDYFTFIWNIIRGIEP